MSAPAVRRATYEDLCLVPEPLVAEILAGTLYTSPRPAMRHARSSSILGGGLVGPFDLGAGGPGGWLILDEPELHLDEDVLVPDLAGWRRERLPRLPDVAAMTLAPDWVCEVLSPATVRLDRALKMPIYAREGVAHLWLVDPIARTLEVYRLTAEGWLLVGVHEGAAKVRAEPFDAVELDLAPLWLEEEPRRG
jgi:Uma2 family endonuclease